jgi:hypothetical protein
MGFNSEIPPLKSLSREVLTKREGQGDVKENLDYYK